MTRLGIAVLLGTLCLASPANAGLFFITSQPTGNPVTDPWSNNFTTVMSSKGVVLDTRVNFDGHALGAVDADFYSGVTMNVDGDTFWNRVVDTPPNGTNLTDAVAGEPVDNSRYLRLGRLSAPLVPVSFTMTFDNPVFAVGFEAIDKYSTSSLTLEVFGDSGLIASNNFTGTNFQTNKRFFVGFYNDTNENLIRSFKLTFDNAEGDLVGIDDIQFGQAAAVPEPSSILLLAISCGAGGAIVWKRRGRGKVKE